MQNATVKYIRLSPKQSLFKYGNPYGADANMFMFSLNTIWKARIKMKGLLPASCFPEIDADLKELVAYLREHERARPWAFNEVMGYHYIDLSESDWEGRMRNQY